MSQFKALVDEYGIIYSASKALSDIKLKEKFIETLAELENHECHRTHTFPKTRLHRIQGITEAVYRADIHKTSGWRMHVQYINYQIHLKDIIPPSKHDNVVDVVKTKRDRYN